MKKHIIVSLIATLAVANVASAASEGARLMETNAALERTQAEAARLRQQLELAQRLEEARLVAQAEQPSIFGRSLGAVTRVASHIPKPGKKAVWTAGLMGLSGAGYAAKDVITETGRNLSVRALDLAGPGVSWATENASSLTTSALDLAVANPIVSAVAVATTAAAGYGAAQAIKYLSNRGNVAPAPAAHVDAHDPRINLTKKQKAWMLTKAVATAPFRATEATLRGLWNHKKKTLALALAAAAVVVADVYFTGGSNLATARHHVGDMIRTYCSGGVQATIDNGLNMVGSNMATSVEIAAEAAAQAAAYDNLSVLGKLFVTKP